VRLVDTSSVLFLLTALFTGLENYLVLSTYPSESTHWYPALFYRLCHLGTSAVLGDRIPFRLILVRILLSLRYDEW